MSKIWKRVGAGGIKVRFDLLSKHLEYHDIFWYRSPASLVS